MSWRSTLLAVLAASACVSGLGPAHADGPDGRYVAPGTTVARGDGQTVADDGSVVCDGGDGVGIGGLCLPFGGGDAVEVVDEHLGREIPFQVCVDNNGDGYCTANDPSTVCPDQIAFSHDDDGNFFNPVGPVPTGFAPGCLGGPWRGYVVFICAGTHTAGIPHVHSATTGTGHVTTGGQGLGTFCGSAPLPDPLPPQPVSKPYRVTDAPLAFRGDASEGPCRLYANTDPTAEPGTQTGQIEGGPVTAEEVTGNPAGSFTLTCRVQVNVRPHGGLGGQVQGHGTGVVTAGPSFVAYYAVPGDDVYVCAEAFTDDGTELDYDASTGTWVNDPSVPCALSYEVTA